jgi:predicted RNA-binding Zn ribbon-like protein
VTAELLVRLANLTLPRKPGRGPRVHPDPLANVEEASEALGVSAVPVPDLAGLRALHELVVDLVDRLLEGRALDEQAARLTALAQPSRAEARLEPGDAGELQARLRWHDPSPVAGLARRVVLELGEIEPARLRRCARPECDLVFYDATRSGTRRWHAESPCGQRERQRRFRGAHRAEEDG